MGVAKPDFSQMCRSRSDLIENAENFARIDLDWSDFEKERNQLNPISQLRGVTCHMGSTELKKSRALNETPSLRATGCHLPYSVTCHPTQVNP